MYIGLTDSHPGAGVLEKIMDEEALNTSIRKFLKTVGVNSQREIEQAATAAAADRPDTKELTATMTLEILELGLKVKYDGSIKL